MAFGEDLDSILPSYLTSPDKERLKTAISQFVHNSGGKVIDYHEFYRSYPHEYFMQSDLVREIRMPLWNDSKSVFDKTYSDAIIISNTCDISFDNTHAINSKECLLAPILDFNEYLADLATSGLSKERLMQFTQAVKSQLVSNLFYLPATGDKEYIAILDKLFWFPVSELNSYIPEIKSNRIVSLSHFGHYLFILKLSYHLCRLPEQCDREVVV